MFNNFKSFLKALDKKHLLLPLLLFLNFFIRIFIFYNTTLFNFSDYSAYLGAIEEIKDGNWGYLQKGNFMFCISYIGYFFKYILGNINYFFIFNCLLGTLVSFLVYKITIVLWKDNRIGLLTVLFQLIYTEFLVFSSVFYTPIFMLVLLSLVVLLLFKYLRAEHLWKSFGYLALMSIIVLISFFIKGELKYISVILIVSSLFLFLRKNNKYGLKLLLAGVLTMALVFSFEKSKIISVPEGNVIANDFIFFGHTDYGGDGGDGAFIYKENEERYNDNFNNYLKENNLCLSEENRKQLTNDFQSHEIKKFIKNNPISWLKLQLYKLSRTFGIIPEGNSFRILYTGIFSGKSYLTAILTVIPILIIIPLCFLTFRWKSFKSFILENDLSIIWFLFFGYYVIATVFYGQYQERYRIPVMVSFIIPYLSYSIINFKRKDYFKFGNIIIRLVFIGILFSGWYSQIGLIKEKKEIRLEIIEKEFENNN